MPAITQQQLIDASRDAEDLGAVVNGGAAPGEVVTRLGLSIKTLARVIADMEGAAEGPISDAIAAAQEILDDTQAVYDAALAIQALGDDAVAIAARALKDGSNLSEGDAEAFAEVLDVLPAVRETAIRMSGRAPLPACPVDLRTLFTPAPTPYERTDANTAVIGFDSFLLISGEDGVMLAINKHDLSTMRVDREPDWNAAPGVSPWFVALATKAAPDNNDSGTPYLMGSARETWTYSDPGIAIPITTGYAVVVGTGDRISAGVYYPPTVMIWREGAEAAQSVTDMLDQAGIMGGSYTTPRCLQGASRTSEDTFYLYGSGRNQSTNPDNSRPTFGKMVLTMNGAKTRTGATAVSSLTWTDYLSNLQAAMPGGETIVNVAAAANQLLSGVLYVMVVTEDGGGVLRARLVGFTVATQVAALDTLDDAVNGTPTFPVTPFNSVVTQLASICVSPTGILWTIEGAGGFIHTGFRLNAGTVWQDTRNQVWRALGLNSLSVYGISYDTTKSRFVVAGGSQGTANVGWLDSLCKQGRPYSRVLPPPLRFPADNAHTAEAVWTDAQGTTVVGYRQLAMFLPANSIEPPPTRVLWGLRVTPHASADTVTISEGEAEIYQYNGAPPLRVYYGGGTLAGINGDTFTYAIVLTTGGAVQRPGNGFVAGLSYPEPALWNQCLLATVLRTATNAVITTGEIDQTTFRDQ